MAENSSRRRISISFTLPISCQICLGKVKQPIVCPNHHVFCSVCIELWLQHNQQCPTCRVPITPENPCKQILGGQTQDGESDSYMSNPALRRTRFDILYQDFEREIKRLEQENELLQNSNCQLQLIAAEKLVASRSELISNPISTRSSSASSPGSKPKFTCTPSPRPSPFGFKWKSKQEKCDLFSSSECNGGYSGDDAGNGEMLAVLRSKLKQATSLYDKIKQDMEKLKETNLKLSADKRTLLAETGRLKQAASARSPYKMPLSGAARLNRYIEQKKKKGQYELRKEKHATQVRNGPKLGTGRDKKKK